MKAFQKSNLKLNHFFCDGCCDSIVEPERRAMRRFAWTKHVRNGERYGV